MPLAAPQSGLKLKLELVCDGPDRSRPELLVDYYKILELARLVTARDAYVLCAASNCNTHS